VSCKNPKYPNRITVYMAFTALVFACLNVLLNEPRLILALLSLNLAFSSYLRDWPAIFSAKMSMSSVSSWI